MNNLIGLFTQIKQPSILFESEVQIWCFLVILHEIIRCKDFHPNCL